MSARVDDPSRLGETHPVWLVMADKTGDDWSCWDTRAQAETHVYPARKGHAQKLVWETTKTYSRFRVDSGPRSGKWSYYWAVDRAGAARVS